MTLLLCNVPLDCPEEYLRKWIEARGYRVSRLTLIQDIVSESSPSFAHVQLMHEGKTEEASRALNGQALNGRTIQAKLLTSRSRQPGNPKPLRMAV